MSSVRQKMKIKKGDKVIVTAGKDKGKTGEVNEVITETRRVIVSGVNVVTKHQKPTQVNPQGGLQKVEKSIDVSNVALLDPKENKATRVGYKTLKDGKKVRFAKRSGETIE